MARLTKTEVRALIDNLGGPAKVARDLGIGLSTAAYWRQKGVLPKWRWSDIDTLATLNGVELPPAIVKSVETRAA